MFEKLPTAFSLTLARCGLSHTAAAAYLDVRPDTVSSWASGRNAAPPGVWEQLRALYHQIDRTAAEALQSIRGGPDVIELGLASTDEEARSLGWPCVGAHAALLGLVVVRCHHPCVIVPRGSTPATAAAIKVRRPQK